MKIAIIAFTDSGYSLGEILESKLKDSGESVSVCPGYGPDSVDYKAWTSEHFHSDDALVFIGACGIAVRSIAPLVKSKVTDPAVLVIDELAMHCIPILSGHIGGANRIAKRIAGLIGATPVLTTATDLRGVFAFDAWAAENGMTVANPERIKKVSGALLRHEDVLCSMDVPIEGAAPYGVNFLEGPLLRGNLEDGENFYDDDEEFENEPEADVSISVFKSAGGLRLIPKVIVLGIGCRKGASKSQIEKAVCKLLVHTDIDERALLCIASIDLKANEPGLLAFAGKRGLPFKTFTAEELNAQEGKFTDSKFVESVTGTGSVCERAVSACGARLVKSKTIIDCVTLAIGLRSPGIGWPE